MYWMTIAQGVVAALLLWVVYSRFLATSKPPFPPGPPAERFLGHLRVVPTSNPELAYHKWSKQYGDVLYFNVLGQQIVVLNSVASAVDLLDKRGANYSDRPRFALFECMGWIATLSFMQWGPRFQMHRKLIQSYFTKQQIARFREMQTAEARILVKNLMESPQEFDRLTHRLSTAIIMRIAFGHRVNSDNDHYIQMSKDASYALGHAGAPGGTPTDFFPALRFLPNWLARSWSLKFARDWRWAIRNIHDVPFAEVQERMKEGTAESSFLQTVLEGISRDATTSKQTDMTLEDAKGAAATIYAAGQDTTWSTLVVFLLCVVLHPEVQKKAQAEIEAVVGSDRLPELSDRAQLPYIDYVVQETLRWHPVSALGVPHKSLADDVYRGMHIPKGSVVIANATAMCYDDTIYKNPQLFNPDRYAPQESGGNEEPYPSTFGFGRRICPGRHLAEATLWIVIATVFATLTIGKEIGPDGKEVPPDVEFTAGLTSHPEAFKCTIHPRSKQLAELVANATMG